MAFNITSLSNIWSTFKDEVKECLNRSIDKTGDTIPGALTMENTLTLAEDSDVIGTFSHNREAASKGYVNMMAGFIPGDTALCAMDVTKSSVRYLDEGSEELLTKKINSRSNGYLRYKYKIHYNAYTPNSDGCSYFYSKATTSSSYRTDMFGANNYITFHLTVKYEVNGFEIMLFDDKVTWNQSSQVIKDDVVDLPVYANHEGTLTFSMSNIEFHTASQNSNYFYTSSFGILGTLCHGNNILNATVS